MRILDKYIVREYLKTFLVILFSFSVLFIVIDVFDRLPRLLRKDASFDVLVVYFALRIPYLFVLTCPVVSLLTGLFLMNSLSKFNESIAIRAAGISIYRMVLPVLWVGLLISLVIGIFGEVVLPATEAYRDRLYEVRINKQSPEDIKMRSNIHYVGRNNHLYYIGFFDGYQNVLKIIDIIQVEPKTGRILKKISAMDAVWDGKQWLFKDCFIRTFKNDNQQSYQYYAQTKLKEADITPIDFIKLAKKTMSMNYLELSEYIQRLKKVGEEYRRELVDLHMKISFPLANLIILFFCVPLATASLRSKGRGLIFLLGILICFLYLSALRISQSLGYNAILDPMLAAWLPNILFSILGFIFIIKAEV